MGSYGYLIQDDKNVVNLYYRLIFKYLKDNNNK